MKEENKTEIDFTDQIKAMRKSEAGVLDRVSNYVFTTKEAAADKAQQIGLVADDGLGIFHALEYKDTVVFVPGRNSKEFHNWYWEAHSSEG